MQQPMLNTAIKAARKAGEIIIRYADRLDEITVAEKSTNDFVSKVDQAAEKAIIDTLLANYPDHAILAEESGSNLRKSDYEWIIDPLDGTTNYLHGMPQYAVSIALRHQGKLTQAVIYDPAKDELFTATRGKGAMLNNRRIRVSKRVALANGLLATGIPDKPSQPLETQLKIMSTLAQVPASIRRPGAAALDLAYVAAGRFDGFWEFGLKPWDMAAGVLLIQEAGGLVADFEGGNTFMDSGNILAANPRVFKAMLRKIHPLAHPRTPEE